MQRKQLHSTIVTGADQPQLSGLCIRAAFYTLFNNYYQSVTLSITADNEQPAPVNNEAGGWLEWREENYSCMLFMSGLNQIRSVSTKSCSCRSQGYHFNTLCLLFVSGLCRFRFALSILSNVLVRLRATISTQYFCLPAKVRFKACWRLSYINTELLITCGSLGLMLRRSFQNQTSYLKRSWLNAQATIPKPNVLPEAVLAECSGDHSITKRLTCGGLG